MFPQGISLFPYLKRLNINLIISIYGKSRAAATLLLIAVRIAIVVDVTVPVRIVRIDVAIIIRDSAKAGQRAVDVTGVNRAIHAVISGYSHINSIFLLI